MTRCINPRRARDAFGLPARHSLASLVGRRERGGCDDCLAERELIEERPGMYTLRIFHDTTCPTLARKRGRA